MTELSDWLDNLGDKPSAPSVDDASEKTSGRHFAEGTEIKPALEDVTGRHFASEVVLPALEDSSGRHFADSAFDSEEFKNPLPDLSTYLDAPVEVAATTTPESAQVVPIAKPTVEPKPVREQPAQPVAAMAAHDEPQHFAAERKLTTVLPAGRGDHKKTTTKLPGLRGLPSLSRLHFPDLASLPQLPNLKLSRLTEPVMVAGSIAALIAVSAMGGSSPAPTSQAMDTTERVDTERASRGALTSAERAAWTTPTPTVAPTTAPPETTTTTTEPPATTTTTTTAPPPPPEPEPDAGPAGDDVWQRLANCESGGTNHSSGPYYGYFQFLPSTWTSVGGTGLPSDHDYETQKSFAQKLQARSGWGQWPACTSKLGIR